MEIPVRDLAAAIQAVGGNADLAQELFESFLESLDPLMQEIRQQRQAANWTELKDSTHQLHGAAAYCGVPAMKAAAKTLEQAAEKGEPAEIDRLMQALEREIVRLFAFAAVKD